MINPLKAGVTFGALLGVCHFFWSLMVALGWAQPLIDFVFWMHLIQPVFVIRPFSLPAAAALIVFTSIVGFVVAFIFAVLWNKLHHYQGLE
jgi:hypothetical protein